ncbi:hypothetical protein T492DRAFT_1002273 [Pavlovales sp. CCMP2436]|nr:hypothetical protein T492DRAFT_1002273 [Pavlovales sp. CCMP2436]
MPRPRLLSLVVYALSQLLGAVVVCATVCRAAATDVLHTRARYNDLCVSTQGAHTDLLPHLPQEGGACELFGGSSRAPLQCACAHAGEAPTARAVNGSPPGGQRVSARAAIGPVCPADVWKKSRSSLMSSLMRSPGSASARLPNAPCGYCPSVSLYRVGQNAMVLISNSRGTARPPQWLYSA